MSYAFVLAFVLAGVVGDEKLIPLARLETECEVCAILSPDATSLFGVIQRGKLRQCVVWDIPSKSKTVLAEGSDFGFPVPSPDHRSILSFIVRKQQKELATDVDVVVWDIKAKSKTTLLNLKSASGVAVWGDFSPDGNLVAVWDVNAHTVHIWKRDALAKWNASEKVNDVAGVANAEKLTEGLVAMAFTPDGKQIFVQFELASGGWTVEKLDIVSGKTVPFPIQPLKGIDFWPAMIVSRDGKTLWVERDKEGMAGIDTLSGKRKYIVDGSIGGMFGFDWAIVSPDGATCAIVRSFPMAQPVQPDQNKKPGQNKTIVAQNEIRVTFWNLSDGTRCRTVTVQGGRNVSGTFTADSRFFVLSAGEDDRRIDLIDVKEAKVRSSLTTDAPITDISLLDSGEIAVVGVEPKAVVIWKFKPPPAGPASAGDGPSNIKR